jgi:hypothetical protein
MISYIGFLLSENVSFSCMPSWQILYTYGIFLKYLQHYSLAKNQSIYVSAVIYWCLHLTLTACNRNMYWEEIINVSFYYMLVKWLVWYTYISHRRQAECNPTTEKIKQASDLILNGSQLAIHINAKVIFQFVIFNSIFSESSTDNINVDTGQ